MVGVVYLVVLACVLRATTKKGCQLFGGRKVYRAEKILATSVIPLGTQTGNQTQNNKERK